MRSDPTMARLSNLAPIPMECDAPFLKIEGNLPRALNGTLDLNATRDKRMQPS